MAEYIKREDVKRLINNNFSGLLLMIDSIPSDDVAPVVHGRMVETDRPIRDGKSKVYGRECTACKRFTRSPFVDNWNYCPNCGARMDGDEDG